MSKQSVKKTVDSVLNKYEDLVTGVKIWDYGPDDAVFIKGYGAPIKTIKTTKPTSKPISAMSILVEHANQWQKFGIVPPDIIFKTNRDGRDFHSSLLKEVGKGIDIPPPYYQDGLFALNFTGITIMWPEA